MAAYEQVEAIEAWQKEHEQTCARCGIKIDRPPNTAHKDSRIHLCDGCATIEALLDSGVIKSGAEKTKAEFWENSTWAALRHLDWLEEEATLMAIDDALEKAKELVAAGVDLDTPITEISIPVDIREA